MAAEESLMNLGAGAVPFLDRNRLPVLHAVDFPFHGDDPLGKDRGMVMEQGLAETLPRAAGGYRPGNVPLLACGLKPAKEAGGEGGGGILVRERPVEIGANQQGFQCGRFNS